MQAIKDAAAALLAEKKVDLVLGYGAAGGGRRLRPRIARTPAEAAALAFDHHAVNNLAVYLTKKELTGKGKVGVVVKGCDLRAVNALVQEKQLSRGGLHLIGVACDGVVEDETRPFGADNIAPKCVGCTVRAAQGADQVVGSPGEMPAAADRHAALIGKLEAMTHDQRWAYWQGEFGRCVRCYACRQVCPMCYCARCVGDKTVPRWIESSAHGRGNLAWNVTRVFHMSGRCIGCAECERACPAGIPLAVLTRRMAQAALDEFGYTAGTDPEAPTLVGTYDLKDREDFIK